MGAANDPSTHPNAADRPPRPHRRSCMSLPRTRARCPSSSGSRRLAVRRRRSSACRTARVEKQPRHEIPTRHGNVPAQLYMPAQVSEHAVLVMPGFNSNGIDEPRLAALAADIAASGYPVMALALPDLQQFRLTPGRHRRDRGCGGVDDAAAAPRARRARRHHRRELFRRAVDRRRRAPDRFATTSSSSSRLAVMATCVA